MNNYANTGSGSADWLMGTVRKNPEGLLLLAAGCALLLRAGGSHDASRTEPAQQSRSGGTQRGGRDWEMPEGMSRAADGAREYASSVGKTVSETADQYGSAAGEYVDGARRTISDQSAQIAEQAQGTIERIVREQPLAVAIAGLAAGAAIAAAFPTTLKERETLGQVGKSLSESASSAGERLGAAASAAGERLMEVAEEKGLNKEGLKKVASDVADTFGKSVTREPKQATATEQNAQSSGGGASPAGAAPMASPGRSARQSGSTERKGPQSGSKTSAAE